VALILYDLSYICYFMLFETKHCHSFPVFDILCLTTPNTSVCRYRGVSLPVYYRRALRDPHITSIVSIRSVADRAYINFSRRSTVTSLRSLSHRHVFRVTEATQTDRIMRNFIGGTLTHFWSGVIVPRTPQFFELSLKQYKPIYK